MDRYMEAINNEESLLSSLEDKKGSLVASNKTKNSMISRYEEKEKILDAKQKENFKRKHFLENKNGYIKSFVKKALIFGLKSSIGFFVTIGLMSLIGQTVSNSGLNVNLLELILGNIAISTMLGSVEYYNVSRQFRQLTGRYQGNIDEDIETVDEEIAKIQKNKARVSAEIKENQALLIELDEAIAMINSKILEYRTSRNNLIEALIEDLDVHIRNFEYQESDVNKVLEKQIR